MRRGSEADHRPAPVEIVDDVLHLRVGEILEAEKDDQQVGRPQRLEPGDVRAARLDEPGLRVGGEEDAALEPVVPRQDPRQRRERFLGSILVIAGQKHEVLPAPRPPIALVDDEMRVLRGRAGRKTEHCGQQ